MNLLGPILMIIPEELLGLLVVAMLMAGGLAITVGARKTGTALVTTALALPIISAVAQAIVNDIFSFIPDWLLLPVTILVMVLCYGLVIVTMLKALVGERAWNHAIGELLADFGRWFFSKAFSRAGMTMFAAMFAWIGLQGLFA